MYLDHSFEEKLNRELAERHESGKLPAPYRKELEGYETAQVIGVSEEMYAAGRVQWDAETELEHVIHRFKRPSLLVQRGTIEPSVSEHWEELLSVHKTNLSRYLPSVGRIEVKNHSLNWVGSGFLINGDLVVTNRHVADAFVERDGLEFKWKFNDSLNQYVLPRIDFLQEHEVPGEQEVTVASVEYLASSDEPDLAVLRLQTAPDLESIRLAVSAEDNSAILVVGYPWRDSRAEGVMAEVHQSIFRDIYDVKRAAPGKVVSIEGVKVSHDCSTLMGNSGSACLDIESGELVAVHYGGEYSSNAAVDVAHLWTVL